MNGRLQIAAVVARSAASIAHERMRRPRPTTLAEVPPSPDALTTPWLSAALGRPVAGFALGAVDAGTSSRRKLRVDYADGDTAHLFTKSSPTLLTRLVTTMAGLLPAEHAFYAEIRDLVDLEAPAARFSAWDPRTNRSLFGMDDVTVTRGATVDTILTRHTTRAQAESQMDTLARLHARFWGDRTLGARWPWLRTPTQWQANLNRVMTMERNCLVGFKRARRVLPAAAYARRNQFHAALMRARDVASSGTPTFLHCDLHAANWYCARDGTMGLFDWQCTMRGRSMQDVSYCVISNLTVADRRAWERDLIGLYLERLAAHGVDDPPPFDTAWLLYRQMIPHALMFWLGTIGANRLQPEMQPDEISLANLERSGQASVDLDMYGALA